MTIRHGLSAVVAGALVSAFTSGPTLAEGVQLQTQLMNELQNTPSQNKQKTEEANRPVKFVFSKSGGSSAAPKVKQR